MNLKHPGMLNFIEDSDSSNFEWSKDNFDKINKIIDKYPKGKQHSAVLPVLDIAQRQNQGWLSKQAIERVAETLDMSLSRVMEIATLYSMFNLKPIGKYFVQICRTTPCWLRGCDKLINVSKEITGCEIGETSKDNLFTVVEVECLGACCNAPMVQINDYYYEDLDENNFKELLLKLKNGKSVIKGSQINRRSSEPIKDIKNA